jgi:hypothetical protein
MSFGCISHSADASTCNEECLSCPLASNFISVMFLMQLMFGGLLL